MRIRRQPPAPKSLGLDISMRGTGVIVQDVKTQAVVFEQVIKSDSKKLPAGPALWGHNRDLIMDVVERYDPRAIFVEDFSYGSQHKAHDMGANAGVIRMGIYEMGADFHLVVPPVLKKFVSGKGNCAKDVVIKEVWKRWGYDTSDNNLADAYALSEMGAMLLRGTETRTFKDVMSKVHLVKGLPE